MKRRLRHWLGHEWVLDLRVYRLVINSEIEYIRCNYPACTAKGLRDPKSHIVFGVTK